jgi:hypothetical protein
MDKISCQCNFYCAAIHDYNCLYYVKDKTVNDNKCIYRKEGKCNCIIAIQKIIMEDIDRLFMTLDTKIYAKQSAINKYNEKQEEVKTA